MTSTPTHVPDHLSLVGIIEEDSEHIRKATDHISGMLNRAMSIEAKQMLATGNPEIDAVIELLFNDPTGWHQDSYTLNHTSGEVAIWTGSGLPHLYRPIKTYGGWWARWKLRKAIKVAAALAVRTRLK